MVLVVTFMMGQIPNCGTGETDILIDESKLFDVPGEDPEDLEDIDKWESADYCDENIGMEFDESAVDTIKSSSFVKTQLINTGAGGGTVEDK